MKLKVLFDAVGIISLLLLVFQVILQVIQMRENRVQLSRWRIRANWILVLLLVIGFSGGAWSKSRTIQISQEGSTAQTSSASSSSTSSHKVVQRTAATSAEVKFKPTVELGKDNTIRVVFTVPAKTQVQLARDDNKQVLATVNNPTNGKMQFSYLFGQDGVFDVLGMNGEHQVEKKLTVNKQGTPAANNHQSSADSQGYVTNYHQHLTWGHTDSSKGSAPAQANANSASQPATQPSNVAKK